MLTSVAINTILYINQFQPKEIQMKKIYIAYGANTNRRAMARRCPNAKPIGAGFIVGQRFKFNNVADIVPAQIGSGVSDAPELHGKSHLTVRKHLIDLKAFRVCIEK